MGSYDTIYRNGTKIFMSMGQNENDNTGAGEIYGFSYNKKTWIKLPGILSPTGELRLSLTGPLKYLEELLDLDVFKVEQEFFGVIIELLKKYGQELSKLFQIMKILINIIGCGIFQLGYISHLRFWLFHVHVL